MHPIFCSIQDAPCIQFYNIESAPLICPNIQGASSIEHTIYGHVLGHKGVHVHPVHPGWIRPWGGGRTTAGVGPLFEWGGRGGNADCEPVSLACVLCRVVGHIVTLELDRRLNENGILCGFQNGFRERRSCETQLIQLVDDLGGRLAKGHRVGLVLLDIGGAFGRVGRLGLLFKLSARGVGEGPWDGLVPLSGVGPGLWCLGRVFSGDTRRVGPPRGSVLGPLLFLLCMGGLPGGIQSRAGFFAGDTAVYLAVSGQGDLNYLQEWERTCGVGFGPGRCQVLHVGEAGRPVR